MRQKKPVKTTIFRSIIMLQLRYTFPDYLSQQISDREQPYDCTNCSDPIGQEATVWGRGGRSSTLCQGEEEGIYIVPSSRPWNPPLLLSGPTQRNFIIIFFDWTIIFVPVKKNNNNGLSVQKRCNFFHHFFIVIISLTSKNK